MNYFKSRAGVTIVPLIVLFILLANFISSMYINTPYTFTRVLITLIFAASIFTLAYNYKTNNIIDTYKRNGFVLILFAHTFLQGTFSDFVSNDFEYFNQIYFTLTFLFIYLIINSLAHGNHIFKLKDFVNTVLISSVLILAFILYFMHANNLSVTNSIIKIFNNIRFLNHLQTLFIPILIYAYLISNKNYKKILIAAIVILHFTLLFHLGSRGTLVSFFLTSAIFAAAILFLKNSYKENVKLSEVIIILHFALISFVIYFVSIYIIEEYILNTITSHSSHLIDFHSSGRIEFFKIITPLIFNFENFFNAPGFITTDIGKINVLHPHNLFLFVFLGSGTFGLLLFIFIFTRYIYSISILFKNKELRITRSKVFLMFTFSSIFIHSLVSGLYITPLTSIFLIYFYIIFNQKFLRKTVRENIVTYKNTKNRKIRTPFIIKNILMVLSFYYLYILNANISTYINLNKPLNNTSTELKKFENSQLKSGLFLTSSYIYKNLNKMDKK